MRTLAVTFFFFVLLFGFGSILLSSNLPHSQAWENNNIVRGQVDNKEQPTSTTIVVDREDDPQTLTPCTEEASDCTLRSAITLANNNEQETEIKFASDYLIRLAQPLPTISADNITLKAEVGQEVHIDAALLGGSVIRVTGSDVTIQGLRIYRAGAGYPNVVISGAARNVIIANNVIGDNDAPFGNCGNSDQAYSGIYIEGDNDIGGETRAWIYGNIIECHNGSPGDGIVIISGSVIVGKDQQGNEDPTLRNIIRNNRGVGVNLLGSTGNTVCDNLFIANDGGAINLNNFHNNNIMFNELQETILQAS